MRSEFEFIKSIRQRFDLSKIGDDCAVLPKDAETDLVITSDLLVEDVDFRREWKVPELLGHKSLAVSLSDVAAMGARPIWAMLSIGIPPEIWQTDFVDRFYDGWFALAKEFDVELVGGDVSKTPERIVIDSTAAGECRHGRAVLRSNARAGDLIFVTGELGGAAIGLKLLGYGERFDAALETSDAQKLILRNLKPTPRIRAGLILGTEYAAAAMIDLSDGLVGDLGHICRESGVGARVFAEKIPLDSNMSELVSKDSEKLNYALGGGEDFELLFTVRQRDAARLFDAAGKVPVRISHIGEITSMSKEIEIIGSDGSRIEPPKSFTHF